MLKIARVAYIPQSEGDEIADLIVCDRFACEPRSSEFESNIVAPLGVSHERL